MLRKQLQLIILSLGLLFTSLSISQPSKDSIFVKWDELELTDKQIKAVPKGFLPHHETLIKSIKTTWNDVPIPSAIGGLFEQETCRSLTHSQCWSTRAELKTSREYGFGLGQITVTSKFNTFNEVKQLDARLKSWDWEDRFNAEYQMISGIAMLKRNYNIFKGATDPEERMAFATASYNGGIGGIQADQRVCRNTPNCDQWKWFGNVEHTSLKAKTKLQGYGKSFFETNREHTYNIFKVRRFKYKPFIDPYFENVQK